MNVLIVGCGYLGSRVAQLLLSRGDSVWATTRSPHKAQSLERSLGVSSLVVDLTNPDSLKQLPSADALIHCVGYDSRSGRTRQDVSVTGLQNLLRALPASVSRFLSTSSTSVYGNPAQVELTEDTLPEPNTEAGRVCLAAEQAILNEAARFQSCVLLRLSGLYGPGRIIRRDALIRGEPITTDPDTWINLVHVNDATSAVVAALHGGPVPVSGASILNVSDDDPGPRRRLYDLTAKLLGAAKPVYQPDPAAVPEGNNQRRISNARLKSTILPDLKYPSIEQGLPAALAEESRLSGPGN